VDVVLHQSPVSSYVESVETTARGTDITVEVSNSQASSCVESLGTTICTIDNPLKETNGHGQPVVMLETLNLSR